jgi:Fic family protein
MTLVIAILMVGIALGVILVPLISEVTADIRQTKTFRKRKEHNSKDERMEALREEIEKKFVLNNNDVQKLFKVSDATATRYLEQLETEGLVKQIGLSGRGVHYIKT